MNRPSKSGERLTEDVKTRLSRSQRELILRAAALARQTPADFVREAALKRAEETLSASLTAYDAFKDFIGCLSAPVTLSAGTGQAFADIVRQRHEEGR